MSVSTPKRPKKTADDKTVLSQVLSELRQLREAVERDREEIERLKAELAATRTESSQQVTIMRPKRMKLTADEAIKRVESFPQRRDEFVASIREGKNRSLPS